MQDNELYERVLGLKAPWKVSVVELRIEESKVTVTVSHDRSARFVCPECGQEASTYDHRRRQWRHLDTCGLVTMIEAEVPRVSCTEHGVRQVRAPWAESSIGFTGKFAVNAMILQVAMVAFNMLRFLGQSVLSMEELPYKTAVTRKRLRKMIDDLIRVAVKLVFHARQQIIKLWDRDPWLECFRRLYGICGAL